MKNASKIWRITHAKTPVSFETGVFIDKKEQDIQKDVLILIVILKKL